MRQGQGRERKPAGAGGAGGAPEDTSGGAAQGAARRFLDGGRREQTDPVIALTAKGSIALRRPRRKR